MFPIIDKDILDNRYYNISLSNKFNISQTLTLTRSEIETLREIEIHLDDNNYIYKSEDGVIEYEKGKLVLHFETNDNTDQFNNTVCIEDIKAFIDEFPNLS